jgi:hypothetical protein
LNAFRKIIRGNRVPRVRSLKARGVVFVREPREETYGTAAVFEDLYGNLGDLIQNNVLSV